MTTIAFRVDADAEVGLGHAMRCLALAMALVARGVQAVFLSCTLPERLVPRLRQCGVTLIMLRTAETQRDDAAQVGQALAALSAAWICVDHYGLGEEWERLVADGGVRVAAIDDYGQRRHACALLIDHNVGVHDGVYEGLLPTASTRLFGPRFALLRPEFAARSELRRRTSLRRLQISFGGADPSGETSKALAAVIAAGLQHVEVDVVVGAANPRVQEVRAAAARLPSATVHVDVERMDELLHAADVVLGAAGVSVLERCALGVPSLLVVVADNQRQIAAAAAGLGVAVLLGNSAEVSAADIARVLCQLASDPETIARMSSAAAAVCDGAGAGRVADAMLASCGEEER